MSATGLVEPVLKPLFAKVLDRFFLCGQRYQPSFTDFYDPAKWTVFFNALKYKNKDIEVVAFGGAEDCERRMLGFFPIKYNKSNEVSENVKSRDIAKFPIVSLRIEHNTKFNKTPRHQDYLGSVLGLGFDRGRIGDIFISKEHADIFVYEEIADYICSQLEKIGRVPVKCRVSSGQNLEISKPQELETQINVASMRLDVIAAAAFRLSRGQVQALIGAEKVFVNWSPCADRGKNLKPGDMISAKGYGRVRIGEILGTTKKDRIRLGILRQS